MYEELVLTCLKNVLSVAQFIQHSSPWTETLFAFLVQGTSGFIGNLLPGLAISDKSISSGERAAISIDSLCGSCKWPLQHAPTTSRSQRSGRWTVSATKLISGAETGCWSCSILLSATTQLWDVTEEGLLKMIQFWVRYDVDAFTVHGQNALPTIQIFTRQGDSQVGRYVPAFDIAPTADSADLLDFTKTKVSKCLKDHISCRKNKNNMNEALGARSPRRMLEIDARKEWVKLVDFEAMKSQDYSALSYCWGNEPYKQLRATADTVPGLRAGIPTSELPATLRDAVILSTKIDIHYIWIDSLCIIQDDEEDWESEAAKMSTVYSNAVVTIIAGSAGKCDQGFLGHVREPSVRVGDVHMDDHDAPVYARRLRDWGYHRNAAQGPHSGKDQWLDPVDSRGWILQERLLSTRYINFTTGEAQWGCQEANECECGQSFTEDYLGASAEDQWHAVVQEFTRRDLSQQTDTLMAIAGIARKYSSTLDRANWNWYAAGIWLRHRLSPLTARSLLWYRCSRNNPGYFSKEYLGPTFSWASVVGEVTSAQRIAAEGVLYPTTVTGVFMDTNTPNVFGKVQGGHVNLQGPLLAAKMTLSIPGVHMPDHDATIDVVGTPNLTVTSIYLDGVLEKVSTPGKGSTVCRRLTNDLEESEKLRQSASFVDAHVFLLPITADIRSLMRPGEVNDSPQGGALILARSITRPGYERIAVARYTMFGGDWSQFPLHDVSLY
ncbi:heterokaryon incompatibility protein-domain-containing protein [Pestalotiopsis sp. NC0098]|nr:heterokaryon incompatibility protein-domain-containing protein [Pestalotiopsis sp. NC0098]